MRDKDNFEKYIQDTLENYEPPVGMEQWEAIASKLPQSPWRFKWILPYFFSLLLFLGGGIVGYFYSKKPMEKNQNSMVLSSDTLYVVKVDTVFVKGENKIIYRSIVRDNETSFPAGKQGYTLKGEESSIYLSSEKDQESLGRETNEQTFKGNGTKENSKAYNPLSNKKSESGVKIASETTDNSNNALANKQDFVLENTKDETEEKVAVIEEIVREDTSILKEEEKDSIPPTMVEKNSWQFDYGFSAAGVFPLRSFYEYKASFVPGVDIAVYKGKAGIRLGLQYLYLRSEIDEPYFLSQDVINTLPNYPAGQILDDIKIHTQQILLPLKFSWKIKEEKQNSFFVEAGLMGRYAFTQVYYYEFASPSSNTLLQVDNKKQFLDISHYIVGIGTNSSLSKRSSLYLGVEYLLPSSVFQSSLAPTNPIHFHAFSLNMGLRFMIQ